MAMISSQVLSKSCIGSWSLRLSSCFCICIISGHGRELFFTFYVAVPAMNPVMFFVLDIAVAYSTWKVELVVIMVHV